MEIDLSEFEIFYFIMLSPKLLNSFEKSSGLLRDLFRTLSNVPVS